MATGEHNQYVWNGQVGLLWVEPKGPPSKDPIIDSLTRKMAHALRHAHNGDNGRWWRGIHSCSCGASSDHKNHFIISDSSKKIISTNSLAVHYLAMHRSEVPQADLDRVAKFQGETEPTSDEVADPLRRSST